MSDQVFTDDQVLDKVAKLLKLAGKAGTPEEAATAASKAQALMVQYNLTEVALERRTGKTDGRRESAMVEGGHYKFQRDLFEAVAKMNFCIAWNENYYTVMDKDRPGGYNRDGRYKRGYKKGDDIRKSRFKVIGRMANVQATRVMFNYMMASVTRILRERVRRSDGVIPKGSMMDGWAVSFREGAVANLMSRIWSERRNAEKERQAKADAAAKMAGAATSTALTLADLEDSEYIANYDVAFGEGAWQERMEARAEKAEQRRLHDEEMARLAKEDPDEHRRREEAARKKRRETYGRSQRERYVDPTAFRAGHSAADKISLNQQVDETKPVARIGRTK